MRFASFAFLLAVLPFSSMAGASLPKIRVNPATLQSQDQYWQHARLECLADSTEPIHATPRLAKLQCGNRAEKEISITFDDGPHGPITSKLLDILREQHVKATFFLVGKMVERYPNIVRQIESQGHEVGNHTFSHVTLTRFSPEDVETEYRACNDLLASIIGHQPRFCRPPGGDCSKAVLQAAANVGLTTVMWTDDPGDYDRPSDEVLEKRILSRAGNGGIILLHDGIPQTLAVLPAVIEDLRAEGYRIVPLARLEADLLKHSAHHNHGIRMAVSPPARQAPSPN